MYPQLCRHAQRQNSNSDHQPAILRRHRRGSEGIGDPRKLLGAAPIEDGTDGTTMAKGKSGKTLMPCPASSVWFGRALLLSPVNAETSGADRKSVVEAQSIA